ncbi:hypothetical protein ACU8OJ_25330 (plasmid) [Rhizobium leguminosarum]
MRILWRSCIISGFTLTASLLIVISIAFAAGHFASVIRFAQDRTLAPRDVPIYGNEVSRVAGAAFLVARRVGQSDVYADQTVRTIGGVIYQETARPAQRLSGSQIDLAYNPSLPDGSRLEVRIDGKTFKTKLFDWALVPISNFANSPNTAVVSLLARPQSPAERSFERTRALTGKAIFWIQVHPDLKNTLVGFNALLTDAMLLQGNPGSTRKFTESLTPKIVGWNASRLDDAKSLTASQGLSSLLSTRVWHTYIFNDLNSDYVFSTEGDTFVIKGALPTYHFFRFDDGALARPVPTLTNALRVRVESLGSKEEGLRILDQAVYDTSYKTAEWAAFFRYMKANHHPKWAAYLASLDRAANVLAVETPVAWQRR